MTLRSVARSDIQLLDGEDIKTLKSTLSSPQRAQHSISDELGIMTLHRPRHSRMEAFESWVLAASGLGTEGLVREWPGIIHCNPYRS